MNSMPLRALRVEFRTLSAHQYHSTVGKSALWEYSYLRETDGFKNNRKPRRRQDVETARRWPSNRQPTKLGHTAQSELALEKFGGPPETRTPDPLIKSFSPLMTTATPYHKTQRFSDAQPRRCRDVLGLPVSAHGRYTDAKRYQTR